MKRQKGSAKLEKPIKDPARLKWREVKNISHYWIRMDAARQPMHVRES